MKKVFLLLALATMYFGASAQKVNDHVSVEHDGNWYEATVLRVDAEKNEFFIKYDDWDESWNEWVGPSRIKGGTKAAPPAPAAPLTKYKVGDKVEVEYVMIPQPATVVEVGENKYHIKYDNSLYGDKWVSEKQIKKL